MEFIIADNSRIETGFLDTAKTIDMDNYDIYDFELSVYAEDSYYRGMGYGAYIFVPGSEYGGRFGMLKSTTKTDIVSWTGLTWRGMLEKKVIQPPAGNDYYIVSGDANDILRALIGDMAPLIVVPDKASGIRISSHQFDRYVTIRKGVEDMLMENGGKLRIHAEQGGAGEPFQVEVECVPLVNYSDEIEYSQDSAFEFIIEEKRDGVNHLICLGAGDLAQRQVIHLYADGAGNISDTQSFFGSEEIVDVFDFSSAESLEELRSYGVRNFREKMSYKSFSVDITDGAEYDIGDIVSGRDRNTNLTVIAPIIGKIYRCDEKGNESIEYRLEGG